MTYYKELIRRIAYIRQLWLIRKAIKKTNIKKVIITWNKKEKCYYIYCIHAGAPKNIKIETLIVFDVNNLCKYIRYNTGLNEHTSHE